MMKHSWITLGFLIFSAAASATEDPFLAAIESLRHSVAPIVCMESIGQRTRVLTVKGTAFFISQAGEFLTAAHVVGPMGREEQICPITALLLPSELWRPESPAEVLLWFPFKTSDCEINGETDVAKCKPTEDLAALPSRIRIRPVKIEYSSQPDGTLVAFTGFPLNARDPLTSRTGIAGYKTVQDGAKVVSTLILDHVAWHGGSGSPVYLSDGRVIGIILASGIEQATGISLARPAESFREMLSDGSKQTEAHAVHR